MNVRILYSIYLLIHENMNVCMVARTALLYTTVGRLCSLYDKPIRGSPWMQQLFFKDNEIDCLVDR